ncbi:membrane protein [Mycoplasmopsis maculosa]|uniref:Membrane protein n=1 Tax=Mycoplasmopsis maculosa TaxID=114885 RepID=A0A449B4U5_9BACT|nr:hypothetical protein [Mycoplasmopsis maculosa]VEU75589.1 membrane protein [Mycoplasmopsis maculosa]
MSLQKDTKTTNKEDLNFTAVHEINKIRILTNEEIANLDQNSRDEILKDTVNNIDPSNAIKYRKNIKNIIISAIFITLFFITLIITNVLLVLYLIGII